MVIQSCFKGLTVLAKMQMYIEGMYHVQDQKDVCHLEIRCT